MITTEVESLNYTELMGTLMDSVSRGQFVFLNTRKLDELPTSGLRMHLLELVPKLLLTRKNTALRGKLMLECKHLYSRMLMQVQLSVH